MDPRFTTIGAAADWINKRNHLSEDESIFLDLVRNFRTAEQATFCFVNNKYYHIYDDGCGMWSLIMCEQDEQEA